MASRAKDRARYGVDYEDSGAMKATMDKGIASGWPIDCSRVLGAVRVVHVLTPSAIVRRIVAGVRALRFWFALRILRPVSSFCRTKKACPPIFRPTVLAPA